MFSWICIINGFLLSWIMSYTARICFQSIQETKMAEENNTPELVLSCLISGPVLTWRDLCLRLVSCSGNDSQKSGIREKSNFYHTFHSFVSLFGASFYILYMSILSASKNNSQVIPPSPYFPLTTLIFIHFFIIKVPQNHKLPKWLPKFK